MQHDLPITSQAGASTIITGLLLLLVFPTQLSAQQPSSPSQQVWYNKLPPCPCTFRQAQQAGRTQEPAGEWEAEQGGTTLAKFHYGAAAEARWKPETGGAAGQQCTYDAKGNLITGGLAAGTPDKVSPQGVWALLHYRSDVQPWSELPCVEYLRDWLPNKGSNCSVPTNSVHDFSQLTAYVSTLSCETISELFRELLSPSAPWFVHQFMQRGTVTTDTEAQQLTDFFSTYHKGAVQQEAAGKVEFAINVLRYLREYQSPKVLVPAANAVNSISALSNTLFQALKTNNQALWNQHQYFEEPGHIPAWDGNAVHFLRVQAAHAGLTNWQETEYQEVLFRNMVAGAIPNQNQPMREGDIYQVKTIFSFKGSRKIGLFEFSVIVRNQSYMLQRTYGILYVLDPDDHNISIPFFLRW